MRFTLLRGWCQPVKIPRRTVIRGAYCCSFFQARPLLYGSSPAKDYTFHSGLFCGRCSYSFHWVSCLISFLPSGSSVIPIPALPLAFPRPRLATVFLRKNIFFI